MKSLQEIYFSNLNVVCNTSGAFFCPDDFSWTHETHTFNQNKFYFITDGQCVITIQGTTYTARAGQWFFIPARASHSYSSIEGCTFRKYWMHFDLYPSAIMEQIGFYDENQFSKQFKKYYGHSPRNYRKFFRKSL